MRPPILMRRHRIQKFRNHHPHADADVKFYGGELHHRLLPGIRPGIMTKGDLYLRQTLVQLYSMAFDSFNMGYASTQWREHLSSPLLFQYSPKHMTKGIDLADGRNTGDAMTNNIYRKMEDHMSIPWQPWPYRSVSVYLDAGDII